MPAGDESQKREARRSPDSPWTQSAAALGYRAGLQGHVYVRDAEHLQEAA